MRWKTIWPPGFGKDKAVEGYLRIKTFLILLIGILFLLTPFWAHSLDDDDDPDKKKETQKQKITEEIVVTAPGPKSRPVSTVHTLSETDIERIHPLDLSEAIRYAPGVTVTFGNKSVYTLKLRGVDSRRIVLLVDGIPVYEPYFSTFDLKTIATGGIETVKMTKGPSSVLYGPNTMGGIVNVITQRPSGEPRFQLNASYGERNTRQAGFQSAFHLKNFSFLGNFLYQDSDGFYYPDSQSGERKKRWNSQYQRSTVNAKVYYNPNPQTELLFNTGIYLSQYSMPPGLKDSRPRYWRFKNWDRYSFNAGGVTALGKKSSLRFRAFLVQYDNTLDMYRDLEMTLRRFESTFDNSVYGVFALGDFYVHSGNRIKMSVNYKGDKARIQDDGGLPWTQYDQGTFSLGLEDHRALSSKWKLVGGVSFDYLNKYIGENIWRFNPLVGIQFSPENAWGLHLSFSKKSKFPSMRSMYAGSSGNPDLLSESGTNWELGFSYKKDIFISGTMFLSWFKDMIDSVRLPQYDFRRLYFNIDKAHIHGLEIQVQKSFSWMNSTLNYTFLHHRNESDDQPLDALPPHNLNLDIQAFPLSSLRVGLMGLWASSSSWLDYRSGEILDIPSYFNLDAVISYKLGEMELFAKITNVFNQYIYTEPGYPWRARFFELGFKANILE